MTDKEFKRLSRAQLIDIIYQLQLQVDELTEQKQKLETALADKQLRISIAGNIADAALEINDCFRSAQNAAEQYLNEIVSIRNATQAGQRQILSQANAEAERLLAAAQTEATQMIADAQREAHEIRSIAKRTQRDYDAAIDMILRAYEQSEVSEKSDS